VARALIADPAGVGWRAYKSVYPKCSRHAAETGYTRLSKNADFAARIDELKAAAAEGAAVRSFFASLTMRFTITSFAFGPGVLRFTIDRLLLRTNSATL
jgi:hypothetical protein